MNRKYKIIRWDPVILDENNNIKKPKLFITPDNLLLDYVKENLVLEFSIYGTGNNYYDGDDYKGYLNLNNYSILLDKQWKSYPDNFGIIQFKNIYLTKKN
mgnify:CR=1 FL=1